MKLQAILFMKYRRPMYLLHYFFYVPLWFIISFVYFHSCFLSSFIIDLILLLCFNKLFLGFFVYFNYSSISWFLLDLFLSIIPSEKDKKESVLNIKRTLFFELFSQPPDTFGYHLI